MGVGGGGGGVSHDAPREPFLTQWPSMQPGAVRHGLLWKSGSFIPALSGHCWLCAEDERARAGPPIEAVAAPSVPPPLLFPRHPSRLDRSTEEPRRPHNASMMSSNDVADGQRGGAGLCVSVPTMFL